MSKDSCFMCDSACRWWNFLFEIMISILKIFRGWEILNLIWSMQTSFHPSSNRISWLKQYSIQNYFAPIITSAPIITAPIITSALIASIKKVRKQPSEVKRQSPEGFCKKGILKNFKNFTEKHLRWSLFDKVANLQPERFLKRDSNSNAFLWSFQNG